MIKATERGVNGAALNGTAAGHGRFAIDTKPAGAATSAKATAKIEKPKRPKPTSTTRWEFFTVVMAIAALASSPGNRHKSEYNSRTLCRDRRRGHWRDNGEIVAFDINDMLRNGHNRMQMIIDDGVGEWLNVCRGVPVDAYQTYDIGKKRSNADVLSIGGFPDGASLAPALRNTHSWLTGTQGPGINGRLSQPMIVEFAKQHKDMAGAVAWAEGAKKSVPCNRSRLAFWHWLLMKSTDQKKAKLFLDNLASGINLSSSDPAYLLRQHIVNGPRGNHHIDEFCERVVGLKAWNSYVTGKPIDRLMHQRGWAIPEVEAIPAEWQFGTTKEDADQEAL